MADGFDIRVLGIPELQAQLEKLAVQTQKRVLGKAMKAGAQKVLAKAKQLCPVGPVKQNGEHLRDTLRVITLKGRGKFIGAAVSTGSRERLGIDPKDKHYYPMALEVGHGTVAARPYMRPALDGQRDAVIAVIADEIGKGIIQEAGKSIPASRGGS